SNSAKWILGTLIVGGTGFLLAFYLGGADSIPRRYSIYPAELSAGTPLALMGAIFATVYLIAILVFFFNISKRCVKVLSSPA
ncbi:MAG TPA: hypothetical protein PKW06_11495, partial [Cyclobacteriaceae bacterium]|nr:hypothetical protein [Cyclobacteriaceae bacterium]